MAPSYIAIEMTKVKSAAKAANILLSGPKPSP